MKKKNVFTALVLVTALAFATSSCEEPLNELNVDELNTTFDPDGDDDGGPDHEEGI